MNTRFDPLWKLMSEHKFLADPESTDEDLHCMWCKTLMVDARQTPCGCQYCYKCISNYLGDRNDRCCPGGKQECSMAPLVPQRDLIKDPKANNKIMKSKVVCPNKVCGSKMELSQMEEHMKTCMRQVRETSSSRDVSVERDEESILKMIHGEIYTHADSIMDNMKNEFGAVKDSLRGHKSEIDAMKQAMNANDERLRREIQGLKEELRSKENRMRTLERRLEEEQRARTANALIAQECVPRVSSLEASLAALQQQTAVNHINMGRRINYYAEYPNLAGAIDDDFVWRFTDLSSMKKKLIFSDAFYCNEYRFSLGVRVSGSQVAVWCYLMKGDNDANLEWPMKDRVTLSVLNQEYMMPHKSEVYQHDTYFFKFKWVFKQSRGERQNSGIGSPSFISYVDMVNAPSVIVDDSIIVSCAIDPDDDSDSASS